MSTEITWGDTVIVSHDAPSQFHPGFRGSVSGICDLGANPSQPEPESETSARLYLVEFFELDSNRDTGTLFEQVNGKLIRVRKRPKLNPSTGNSHVVRRVWFSVRPGGAQNE